MGGSRDEASLSSPEVLRRLECSEDRTRDRFHASVLQGSRLSELSALNTTTGLDLPQGKASTRARMMEQPRSRTITPESVSRSTRSPGSTSASDNFSMACSLDVDKVCGLGCYILNALSRVRVLLDKCTVYICISIFFLDGYPRPNGSTLSSGLHFLPVGSRMG